MLPVDLTDGHVLLTCPTSDDVDDITRLCQDPAIQEWTTVPSPYGREHAVWFVEKYVGPGWAQDLERTWAVRADDGVLAGMVGLGRRPARGVEVGYWLGAEHRGRGLLHRSLHLLLEHAFAPASVGGMDAVRVEWRAFAGNWASWRAAWRVGLTFEGAARLGGVQRERRRDEWLGSLLLGEPRAPKRPWPATSVEVTEVVEVTTVDDDAR